MAQRAEATTYVLARRVSSGSDSVHVLQWSPALRYAWLRLDGDFAPNPSEWQLIGSAVSNLAFRRIANPSALLRRLDRFDAGSTDELYLSGFLLTPSQSLSTVSLTQRLEELSAAGAKVDVVTGNVITVHFPVRKLGQVLQLEWVKSLSV